MVREHRQAPNREGEMVDARTELKQIALSFLRLGATAFGGPAAHIAMMEDEFVRRRGWLTEEEFLDRARRASPAQH